MRAFIPPYSHPITHWLRGFHSSPGPDFYRIFHNQGHHSISAVSPFPYRTPPRRQTSTVKDSGAESVGLVCRTGRGYPTDSPSHPACMFPCTGRQCRNSFVLARLRRGLGSPDALRVGKIERLCRGGGPPDVLRLGRTLGGPPSHRERHRNRLCVCSEHMGVASMCKIWGVSFNPDSAKTKPPGWPGGFRVCCLDQVGISKTCGFYACLVRLLNR
jgi:hypothetical protein